MRTAINQLAVFLLCTTTATTFAQIGQLNGGGGGTTQGAGQGAAAAQGGTTEGTGGITSEGDGSSASEDGGIAGGNLTDVFIGGGDPSAFVGGALQTQLNSNRQFSALFNNTNVPQGGTQQQTGEQRRVPVSFKIGFEYPMGDRTTLLLGRSGPALPRVMMSRPEFRGVALSVDPKGVATLSGQVPSAATARLAANLVRLRPGVRRVNNRIVVAAQ